MNAPRLSVIVPTVGRETLSRALQSVACQPLLPGDEVLLVSENPAVESAARALGYRYIHCQAGNNFGHVERQHAMPFATGTHLMFLDDDDAFLPGAFAAIRRRLVEHPGRPLMFRMMWSDGTVLWREPVVRKGNHGTPQFIVPNDPARLGQWGPMTCGDFDFCQSTLALYPDNALVWDDTIIYEVRPPGDLSELPAAGVAAALAHRVLERKLALVAQQKSRMFHSEVRAVLDTLSADPESRPSMDAVLSHVARNEHRAGRPLLTALIVTGKSIPGNIFFDSARDLGLLKSTDPADEMQFWIDEEAKVYREWGGI